MEIKNKQVFNLMDTNGRRSDVINAYKIYLEVLNELSITHPNEKWSKFPSSVKQILFYEQTLEKSKDVFKKHDKYDKFIVDIDDDYEKFISKDVDWIKNNLGTHKTVIDTDIEQRARHYTSTLVKLGFTTNNREITEVGYAFLNGKIIRDQLEELLPVDDTNILIIRQLAKLKIFSETTESRTRTYYSPFFMALKLLLGNSNNNIDKNMFKTIIQGLSPYISSDDKNHIISPNSEVKKIFNIADKIEIDYPEFLENLKPCERIKKDEFNEIVSTSKNNDETKKIYYNFYLSLQNFVCNQNESNYNKILDQFNNNSESINKAFRFGEKVVFNLEEDNKIHCLQKFLNSNKNHLLLDEFNFNKNFYKVFKTSKIKDNIAEYSDITIRLFGASGLIKFQNLPELSFKDMFQAICPMTFIENKIFGEMLEKEFLEHEVNEDSKLFKDISLSEILGYTQQEVDNIITSVLKKLNVSDIDKANQMIVRQKNDAFTNHITNKYSKDVVVKLLRMFSDRKNDDKIKKAVNKSAPVPTIYEYIVAIAWYYISNCDYNLYESMNLTLNADFEPVLHAGGGAGDIVINYEKSIVMLEVTLMNKQAQKRGEWEPVLRHSLNLKADNIDKEIITFFVADELDKNTINIWRAVAAVPLESTTKRHIPVNGVVIMPLTNEILVDFLNNNINIKSIMKATKESFEKVPKITDLNWHTDILNQIKKV